MVVTKNQIRPRRKKFHFSNAELLGFDTLGFVQLTIPAPLGQIQCIDAIQFRSNIAQVYTNLDAAIAFLFIDDLGQQLQVLDNGSAMTDLLAATGLNLLSGVGPGMDQSMNPCQPFFGFNWTDEAQIASQGGLFLTFSNGVSGDLTGGNAANYLDIFIDYKIINLDI